MSGYVVSLIYTGPRRYPIAWWQVDFIQGNQFSCPTCREGKWSKKLSYTTDRVYYNISIQPNAHSHIDPKIMAVDFH
jgi:hypothetical protein